jgi:DNA polymerase-3 subunit epsilon
MDVIRFRMIDKIFFLIEWLSNHERYSDVNKLIEILDFELAQEYANLTDSERENLRLALGGWPIDRKKLKKAAYKISKVYSDWEKIESGGVEDPMKTYVFVDIETTGLDHQKDQVIEIGAIKTDTKFREIGSFHCFVTLNSDSTLSETITELTGIKESDLKTGLLEQIALKALDYFICDSIFVAHHASFDLSFLSRLQGYQPIGKFICTRSVFKILYPDESASLKHVSEKFGIPLKNHHRALSDARTVKNIYKKMKAELKNHGQSEKKLINTLVESPERPIIYIPNPETKIIRVDSDAGSKTAI